MKPQTEGTPLHTRLRTHAWSISRTHFLGLGPFAPQINSLAAMDQVKSTAAMFGSIQAQKDQRWKPESGRVASEVGWEIDGEDVRIGRVRFSPSALMNELNVLAGVALSVHKPEVSCNNAPYQPKP